MSSVCSTPPIAKPDFSATSKFSNSPRMPLVWLSWLVSPVAAGDEHALGHERLLALGEKLAELFEGIEPRIAERGDLALQDRRLRQTDLHDLLRLAAAGQNLLLAVGLGEHDHLLGLPARAGQFGLGHDDRLLGLLAGAGQIGLALALGNLDLHARVRQLGLLRGLSLGFVEHAELVGRSFCRS